MKKINPCIFFVICLVLSYSLPAQEPVNKKERKCGTYEYLQKALTENPGLKNKMDSIEAVMQEWISNNKKNSHKEIITIPVVVHIVYSTDEQNLSDQRVYDQIEALNRDYRNQNADGIEVPSIFQPYRADAHVEFCLAARGPNNNPTTGIERRHTNENSFSVALDSKVKFYDEGGLDAWNSSKYLNIWVCNLQGNYMGYAQFPGGTPGTDGLLVDYEYFGVSGTPAPFNQGRTAVHEIGHCFNLHHTWGDDENYGDHCEGTDFCSDTPNQAVPTYGNPGFPFTDDCSPAYPGIMFMNYMDYANDDAMLMLTHDQAARIHACLNTIRLSLKLSDGCVPPESINEVNPVNIRIYPNPASDFVTIDRSCSNITGQIDISFITVHGQTVKTIRSDNSSETINIKNLENGLYLMKLSAKNGRVWIKKLIVKHNKSL